MLNSIILMGKIVECSLVKYENDNNGLEDKNCLRITLGVSRWYKNSKGGYDIDYITCLFDNNLYDYLDINDIYSKCNLGDTIGIKGSIEVIDKKNVVMCSRISYFNKANKMVNKIILRDSGDSQCDDLITFDKDVSLADIERVIEEVKDSNEDYTNEDIYEELKKLSSCEIIWIGKCDIVEY